MNTVALTKKLMSIPSVSGDELVVLNFLEGILLDYGFSSVRKIPLEDGTYCLAASKGKSDAWIVGHTDTVPGIVPIEEKDGNLYGRGSCELHSTIKRNTCLFVEYLKRGFPSKPLPRTRIQETLYSFQLFL